MTTTPKRSITGHKLNAHPSWGHPRWGMSRMSGSVPPPHVDLRLKDSPILDQGQEGDCTAAASGGCWRFIQPGQPLFSLDFIYSEELTHDGNFGQDYGSMGSSACYVLENYGVCSPDLFPNNGQGYRTSPSKQAVAAAALTKVKAHQLADLEEVKLCHGQGFPTFFGIPVYPSFVQSAEVMATGQIPLPDPSEQLAGGHELKTVGHDDSAEILILANSWGTGVGDHGYFYLPYAYFEQYADAAYTVRLP